MRTLGLILFGIYLVACGGQSHAGSDSSVSSDGSIELDGGPESDGGFERDGGARVDGGFERDGGARVDGGFERDGGARVDGGNERDGSIGIDGGISSDGGQHDAGSCPDPVDEVDLLLMVDNSNSMAEEQSSLTTELPRLVRTLASGDVDGNGTREFQPVRSIQIGVVTTDMGAGGFSVPTCESRSGDDGRLVGTARSGDPACSGPYPTIFEFQRGVDDATMFAQRVGCVARTGIGGCGFEQPLEAVLKAISPSRPQDWTVSGYVPPVFYNGTLGHADGANAGFVRPNSALAIIMVTDEEDCSAADLDLFNPDSARYGGVSLNLRCSSFDEARHPIARYIRGVDGQSGLLGLRQHPNRLIFAGIVGVPVESVPDPSAIDYAAILNHPLMQEVEDPSMPERLIPSCNTTRGIAFPPRRIVSVAQGIEAAGGRATIQSICQSNFTGALDAIVRKIAPVLEGTCSAGE